MATSTVLCQRASALCGKGNLSVAQIALLGLTLCPVCVNVLRSIKTECCVDVFVTGCTTAIGADNVLSRNEFPRT